MPVCSEMVARISKCHCINPFFCKLGSECGKGLLLGTPRLLIKYTKILFVRLQMKRKCPRTTLFIETTLKLSSGNKKVKVSFFLS